jgi:hypothetical protein
MTDVLEINNANVTHLLQEFGGKLKFNSSSCENEFTGLVSSQKGSQEQLRTIVLRVLTTNTTTINALFVHHLFTPFTFSDDGLQILIQTIYNGFNDATFAISNRIQSKLDTNDFTVDYVLKIYNDYCSNYETVKSLLFEINNYVKFDGYVLYIIKMYSFYNNIINKKYAHKGEQLYLNKLLYEYVKVINKTEVLNIFRIENSFNGFTFSIKNANIRAHLFNSESFEGFDKVKILDNNTVKEFIENIDKSIRQFANPSTVFSEDSKRELLNEVIDIMKMCMKIGDDIYFVIKKVYKIDFWNYLEFVKLNRNY